MAIFDDPKYDKKHRDPKIVNRISRAILNMKLARPGLRVGQIIDNALSSSTHTNARGGLFQIEDDALAQALEDALGREH